jgi:Protein of unknown function (DUF1254)
VRPQSRVRDAGYPGSVQLHSEHRPRLHPVDTAFVTPNSDTPYSFAGLDLRAEPVVITVPKDGEEPLLRLPSVGPLHLQI